MEYFDEQPNTWRARLRIFGQAMLGALESMGNGFAQANLGEAELRAVGREAMQRDAHIDAVVKYAHVPDTVPEDWT